MRLHLISDMHCEFSGNKSLSYLQPPDSNTVLILAGDIGYPTVSTYEKILQTASTVYAKIFIVSGNHEYYRSRDNMTPDKIDQYIKNLCEKFTNVHFLQCDSFVYNRVRFLGCTLWSPGEQRLVNRMNDYSKIPYFTLAKSQELHEQHLAWLQTELGTGSDEYDKTVVITHHLPTYDLICNEYLDHPLNVFFASHNEDLVSKADYWLCGHTHKAQHVQVGKCECYVNPIGYPGENTNFNPKLFIEV